MGTLTLTNSANTLSGTVRIGGGTLLLTNALVLQNATLDLNAADTGTLVTSSSVAGLVLGGLMDSRNLVVPAGPLTIGGNGLSTTYSGNLTAPPRSPRSARALFLSGVNNFGSTLVSGGMLEATTTFALPYSATAGSVSVAAGATLAVQTGNGTAGGWSNAQIGACSPAAVGPTTPTWASIRPTAT